MIKNKRNDTMTIRIPSELKELLKRKANEQNISVSTLIILALVRYLNLKE